jgi:hypothetical protein
MDEFVTYKQAMQLLKSDASNMHKTLKKHGILRVDAGIQGDKAYYIKEEVVKLSEEIARRRIPKQPDEWDTQEIANHFKIHKTTAVKLVKQPGFPPVKRRYIKGTATNATRVWDANEIKLTRKEDFKNYNSPRSERKHPKVKKQQPITKMMDLEKQFLRGFKL